MSNVASTVAQDKTYAAARGRARTLTPSGSRTPEQSRATQLGTGTGQAVRKRYGHSNDRGVALNWLAMNDVALETVSRNVQAARVGATLSLEALAARGDVSKGALVALEGVRRCESHDIGAHRRRARPLCASLMKHAQGTSIVVVDARDVAPLCTGPSAEPDDSCLPMPRPAPVEVWRWVLHPGERDDSHAHQSGVTKTLTVLRGRLLLVFGDTAHALGAGTTTALASDVPHAYEHLPVDHRLD